MKQRESRSHLIPTFDLLILICHSGRRRFCCNQQTSKEIALEKDLEKDLIEETLDEQKTDNWKKVVVIAGALIGGLGGWYFGGETHPGSDIVIGIIVGTFLANWVWDQTD